MAEKLGSSIGAGKTELDTPALCLDLEVVEENIRQMANFFQGSPVRLRPHVKTHKSPYLAHLQMEAGAIGITCAKLGEAEVMAMSGLKDILIANQIVGEAKILRLVNLASYSEPMVAVDDAQNAADLSKAAIERGIRLRVLIEVDVGMHRCGVAPGEDTLSLAKDVVGLPGIQLEGLMGYEGHAVMIKDPNLRKQTAVDSMRVLTGTADLLRREGIEVGIVSAGGTGTFDITGSVPGVTELQVGSYVTMDAQYRDEVGIGFGCALTLLTTVISIRGDDFAVVDAGLKAITRDFGLPKVVSPKGWEIIGLSEEHARLRRLGGPRVRIGDKVEILPNHGCTTINLHDEYFAFRKGVVETILPIAARGKIR